MTATRQQFNEAVCRFYGAADVPAALSLAVERMKREVIAEASGGRPDVAGCTTFGELHDHLDANELGGFCEDAFPLMTDDDDCLRFCNAAQDAVGRWLQSGELAAATALKG